MKNRTTIRARAKGAADYYNGTLKSVEVNSFEDCLTNDLRHALASIFGPRRSTLRRIHTQVMLGADLPTAIMRSTSRTSLYRRVTSGAMQGKPCITVQDRLNILEPLL